MTYSNSEQRVREFLHAYGGEFVDVDYYIRAFHKLAHSNNVAIWNWPAFFFGGIWFFMRGMYKWGFLYFLVEMVVMVVSILFIKNGTIALLLAFASGALFAPFANKFFYDYVIESVSAGKKNYHIDYLAISWYVSIYLFIIEINQWLAISLPELEINEIGFLGPFFPGMVIFAIGITIWRAYQDKILDNMPIISVVFAILLSIIKFYGFSFQMVINSRMQPNYVSGNFLLTSQFAYSGDSLPQVGDVAVIKLVANYKTTFEDKFVLRRIVALAGDRVYIKNGILHINDEPCIVSKIATKIEINGYEKPRKSIYYEESMPWWGTSYKIRRHLPLRSDYFDNSKKFIVPKDYVFVIADHRDSIATSEYPFLGVIPIKNIEEKVLFTLFTLKPKEQSFSLKKIRGGWKRIK